MSEKHSILEIWNITNINIESFFGCHSDRITGDTRIPSYMSMGIHKTQGYPYHFNTGCDCEKARSRLHVVITTL